MYKPKKNNISFLLLILLTIFISCKKPTKEDIVFLRLSFEHKIDNQAVVLNTQHYRNEAGNEYRIDEVKYFISSIELIKNDGTKTTLKQDDGIHYVDMDYPQTLSWDILEYIPEGHYDSIRFIFGMNEADNYSYRFVNPPETNMTWPQFLGGGYHYMMINGKFHQGDTLWSPLNVHLGKGQVYQGSSLSADSIIGFVDNHFQVTLPISYLIKRDQTANLTLTMHIEKWFKEPSVYDFNYWGGHIMQNQAAMYTLKENGRTVFTVE